MLRLIIIAIIFIAIVGALTFGVTFLQAEAGLISMEWGDSRYEMTALTFMLGLIVVMVLLYICWVLIRLIIGGPSAIGGFFSIRRKRKGLDALSSAMIAIAAGDGREATRKARKAESLLEAPELTRLVNAQAAQLTGDLKRTETYFTALSMDPRTEFIGIKGLLEQSIAKDDIPSALAYARRAFALRPEKQSVLTTLFDLQSGEEDWAGAQKTIAASVRAKVLTKDVGARREAILQLSQALKLRDANENSEALTSVLRAVKLAPGMVPAAILAAELLLEDDNQRKASKILLNAWEKTPHPDIASAFANLYPDETAQARSKRFKKLLNLQPEHVESRMLAAELCLTAEEFPAARRALADLINDDSSPNARTCAIMAAIEKGEGASETVVRGWLAKALTAPRGPEWRCDNCGTPTAHWSAVCGTCDAFDTLSWKETEHSAMSETANAAMLPLLTKSAPDEASEVNQMKDITAPVADEDTTVTASEEIKVLSTESDAEKLAIDMPIDKDPK